MIEKETISKREYFAIKAMQSLYGNTPLPLIAERSVLLADELIRQLEKIKQ